MKYAREERIGEIEAEKIITGLVKKFIIQYVPENSLLYIVEC